MDRNIRTDEKDRGKVDPLAMPEDLHPETTVPSAETGSSTAEQDGTLLGPEETGDLRTQWDIIQTGFVDQPRRAVEQADSLVAEALERLTATYRAERTRLEAEWDRTGDVSTEDLRLALQRYRAFFHRLLTT